MGAHRTTFPTRARVQDARRAAGLTFTAMAGRVGMRPDAFRKFERGDTEPNLLVAVAICRELGITIFDLVQIEERPR